MTSWDSRRIWRQLFINHPTLLEIPRKINIWDKLRVLNRKTIFLWWQNVLSIQKFFLIKFHKLRSFHKQFPHKFYVVKWPLKFNSYCADRQLWLEILWSHLYASHSEPKEKVCLLLNLFFSLLQHVESYILIIDYPSKMPCSSLDTPSPFHMPLELCVTLLLLSIDASSPKTKEYIK